MVALIYEILEFMSPNHTFTTNDKSRLLHGNLMKGSLSSTTEKTLRYFFLSSSVMEAVKI